MTGQLYENPLAELIREISSEALHGALRLSRERARIVAYFEAGEIVYGASNLRPYRLANCITRWGLVAALKNLNLTAKATDLEVSAALIRSGSLSREVVDELTGRQISEMLLNALLWTDGDWEFDPRVRLEEKPSIEIKKDELLVESARRLPMEFVTTRLDDMREKLLPVTQLDARVNLQPKEAFVLSRVDTPLTLGELLALAGLPERETIRIIYSLVLGGFLKRERPARAFTADEISRARAIKPATAKAARADGSAEGKGATKSKEETRVEEARDTRAELDELFARLKIATNYYEVLGVIRSATDADIKRAYHSLAKRFHPDLFRKADDAQLHGQVESAFVQIAQAYETLKNRTSRATYDSNLLKRVDPVRTGTPVPASNAGGSASRDSGTSDFIPTAANQDTAQASAEDCFQQGMAALASGNRNAAISLLGEAARIAPNQPKYRAYFGHAMAGDERMRRGAETELKAAIAMDANNPTYRVMLAELYSEIGLVRRAQSELVRALAVEPKHEAARRLLAGLKGKE